MTMAMAIRGYFVIPRLTLDIFYMHTKFGDYRFSRYRDKCKKLQFIHTVNGDGSKTAKIIKRQC